MKRVQITSQIEQHVRKALGEDADLANIHVYEAIALNTRPLRKRHPLYNGAVAERSLLREMAVSLNSESLPVHVEHKRYEGLPLGRVFHGEVVELGNEAELRVLFFLDSSEQDAIRKVENGTVDQVSVSVLPKHLYSSASGFDFFGPEAELEHIWSATDPDGNKIGENGVYGRMVGLDVWMEMSLVGQGGARNARIVRRDQSHFGSSYQKLAASGVDPNAFVLVASATVEEKMDLKDLVEKLTDTKVELSTAQTQMTTLQANLTSITEERDALKVKIEEMGDVEATLSAKDAEVEAAKSEATAVAAELSTAVEALKGVAQHLLTASGKPGETLPETVAELKEIIESTKTALTAALVVGGKSEGADAASLTNADRATDYSAFRTSRK